MEETISFLAHIAGAFLFCVALALLLYIISIEESTLKELNQIPINEVWKLVSY